jgi:hypothetical protein
VKGVYTFPMPHVVRRLVGLRTAEIGDACLHDDFIVPRLWRMRLSCVPILSKDGGAPDVIVISSPHYYIDNSSPRYYMDNSSPR